MSLDYVDLIGVPYRLYGEDPRTGLDCTTLYALLLGRSGYEVPPFSHLGRGGMEDACTALAQFFEGLGAAYFEPLGAHPEGGLRELDAVLSDPGGVGVGSHLSVVVNAKERLAVTASERLGVAVLGHDYIQGRLGVYRPRGPGARA